MRNDKVKVFYTPKQVLQENISQSYSKSPLKPMLLMKKFEEMKLTDHMDVDGSFKPFDKEDFHVAHTEQYVHNLFNGIGNCSSNSVPWSEELVESVRHTNASLYNAIRYSILNPGTPCFSPTSGFHHARPDAGSGFCTFAGQVIASIKIWEEMKIAGCYFDLDGHFGNSIEDCRVFAPLINKAVPNGYNINPHGRNEEYLKYLKASFNRVEDAIMQGKIGYVVWCHGADSHVEDDLGGQVNTEFWVKCAEEFYKWVKSIDEKLAAQNRGPLPVTMSLFGGYRRDSYESVLSLHTKDMVLCLNTLCGHNISYEADVKSKNYPPINTEEAGEFKQISPMTFTKNEQQLLDFLKSVDDENKFYKGNELGKLIKGWANHSMGKWAKMLIKKGLLEGTRKKGYRLKAEIVNE